MNLPMIVIGLGVGIFILVCRFIEMHKHNERIEKAKSNREFELLKYDQWITIFLAVLVLPSIYCAYQGHVENNDTTMALGILLIFLFISEVINSVFILKLYYNDQGCILNDKFVRYKNMKSLRRKYAIPFSKYKLKTFTNETIVISETVAKFLEKKASVPVVLKQD